VPLSLTAVNLLDDQVVDGLVVSAVDITTLAEARSRLHHSATHDPLTGLVNRSLLRDRLSAALERARAAGRAVGLLFCDIDGFKPINDRFGHRAGDDVLVEVARRLLGATRETDVVSRYGGDEFVILLEDADEVVARSVIERVRAALAQPIRLDEGTDVQVRVSVGLAVDPGRGDLDELLAQADSAMYRIKPTRI
jgi:diguanylate cyclase (GGDEF)-like protein